jgi:hypothetical protein
VGALEPAQLGLELVAVLRLLEPRHPLLCGGEGDPVAAFARLHAERDREMTFAGAGRSEEADVGLLLDPGELGEVEQERLLGRGLGRPVEVLQRLQGGEAGVADAHARTGGVAGEHLGLEQALEELLVGPGLGAGPLGRLLEPLQDPRCLQLVQQVGQPLANPGLAHTHSAA